MTSCLISKMCESNEVSEESTWIGLTAKSRVLRPQEDKGQRYEQV